MDDVLLIVAAVAIVLGLAWGLFTRKGSGIDSHPRSDDRR